MRFSIVTPTFDRRAIVTHAIDSALAFARAAGDCELLVVDDASRDGTPDMIRATYPQEIAGGLLVLLQRPANGGATAAKNTGAQAARGDWLIFLDSDDRLLPAASRAIPAFVAAQAVKAEHGNAEQHHQVEKEPEPEGDRDRVHATGL